MEPHKQLTLTNHTLCTVAEKLGYLQLQDWQVSLTKDILNGKDVVFTGGTGCGKTTLLYMPLLAFRLNDPMAVGLSITPTKALGRDQVCRSPCPSAGLLRPCKERSALLKGIPAVAIDEDTASRTGFSDFFPMGHGLYGDIQGGHPPWVMDRTVTSFSMGHGPYGDQLSHGSWAVR